MNDKQFEAESAAVTQLIAKSKRSPKKTSYYDHWDWSSDTWYHVSEKAKKKQAELACINMINSILCYGGFGLTAEQVLEREKKSWHNYLESHISALGEEKVLELIQGQIDSMRSVSSCVFTDSEGGTYNAIVWNDT